MKNNYKLVLTITAFCFLLTGKTSAQIISTVAGNGTVGSSGDGALAINAELHGPMGVALDAVGNLYIADATNNRIRMVNTAGIITTIAGTGTAGFSGDGAAAISAQLNAPTSIAYINYMGGQLFIADAGNNRIRSINSSGTISTIVGNGTAGFTGDGGFCTAAELSHPTGVAFGPGTSFYIADYGNNRIRAVNSIGIVSTYAGNGTGGYTGNNAQATLAELNGPESVSFDGSGNMYIADYSNHSIRKVNASGIISTVVGMGPTNGGYGGDGAAATAAKLAFPTGVTTDAFGNLYIADYSNNRIRKVDASGIITTIAGNGVNSFGGDGGAATAAKLSGPHGVAFSSSGNMYIADGFNNRIRMVTNVAQAGIEQFLSNNEEINVYPNPSSDGNITITNNSNGNIDEIKICNMLGQTIFETNLKNSNATLQIENSGIYFVTVTSGKIISTKKIIISNK